jgi:hypothetical protein
VLAVANKILPKVQAVTFFRGHHPESGPGYLRRYSEWLRARRPGDRFPVEARSSVRIQTGPGAHPASYIMGFGPLQGVKRLGCGVNPSPPSSAEVKERVELYVYSPLVLHRLLQGKPATFHTLRITETQHLPCRNNLTLWRIPLTTVAMVRHDWFSFSLKSTIKYRFLQADCTILLSVFK